MAMAGEYDEIEVSIAVEVPGIDHRHFFLTVKKVP